jgi:hypothetical protein
VLIQLHDHLHQRLHQRQKDVILTLVEVKRGVDAGGRKAPRKRETSQTTTPMKTKVTEKSDQVRLLMRKLSTSSQTRREVRVLFPISWPFLAHSYVCCTAADISVLNQRLSRQVDDHKTELAKKDALLKEKEDTIEALKNQIKNGAENTNLRIRSAVNEMKAKIMWYMLQNGVTIPRQLPTATPSSTGSLRDSTTPSPFPNFDGSGASVPSVLDPSYVEPLDPFGAPGPTVL